MARQRRAGRLRGASPRGFRPVRRPARGHEDARNGRQAFYQALRDTRPDLVRRVVFSTGDAASDGRRRFLEGAGNPVLGKPYDLDSLLATVTRIAEESARIQ